MKILFINFTKFWGGGESWNYQLMDELRKRNHTIVLLSNTKSELSIKSESAGFETHRISINRFSFFDLHQQLNIRKKLIEIKPDAILLNSSLELKTIGFQIKASGCKKVIFMRGIPQIMKINLLKRFLFSNVVSDVIVNSNYVQNSISNITKYLKKAPTVIYHGIQPESSIFAEKNNKNIAIVGRLSNEKGVDLAIKAMKKLLTLEPAAKLWIIGDGKEKDKLVRLTSEVGIQDSVVFHGFTSDVQSYLLQCSVLILTSRWEGFGLVLLEAMKLKIPCVSFDHIAANEIIIDNQTGFLIPNMNIDIMAEKIAYLLKNPIIGNQFGESGNDLLYKKFTIKKTIDRYEAVIKSI
jgi:glycosyltransferase involved in cell wall biosynthesis